MSLSNNYVPIRQIGNGVTVDFSGDWKVLVASYIRVYLEVIATGVQTLQVYGVDYTLVFDDSGFTVTFIVAPTSDNYVVIGRETDQVQAAPYRTAKGFQGDQLETSLDKLVAQVQELQEQVTRAILFPLGSALSGFSFPAPDAGKGLRWNDAEDALQNSEDDLDGIVDAATAQAVIATTQAAAAAASVASIAAYAASAASSASASAASATAAAASATAAAASVTTAAASASAASTSATNAAASATTATTQASNASTSASNASTSATNASNSATTASTQATNAATSATSAATQATNAATSATNAAASATAAAASAVLAAAAAATLQGTSTTSLAIAVASKTWTTQSGKQFTAGAWVLATSDANPANYMHGQVTSYSGTTLTVNVTNIGGSGTKADWTITVSGTQGTTGATGAAGSVTIAAGGGTVDAITADFTPDLTLADKTVCLVQSTGANTSTTPSFAPDSLTAHTIVKKGGVALVAGDIGAAGMIMILEYNLASTRWELLNPCKVTEADITLAANTTNDVTSTKHGLAPVSPADATKFLNGAATPAYAAVKDSDLSTSDVTTNNFTTAKHGFVPKGTNVGSFLKDDGTWATPTGGATNIDGLSDCVYDTATDHNLIIGSGTSMSVAGGIQNTFVGEITRGTTTSATDRNTALGYRALHNITSGSDNTCLGASAGVNTTTATKCTNVGSLAGQQESGGTKNTNIGYAAGSGTGGNSDTTFIGSDVGSAINSVVTNDTGVGSQALVALTSAVDCTAVGKSAGATITSGAQNTCVGSGADVSSGTGTNRTAIGYNASSAGNNTVQLGNSSVTFVRCGSINTTAVVAINSAKVHLKAGVTGNILSSFNVSSLTDTGTGDVAIAFTTSFSGADYTCVVGGERTSSTGTATLARDISIKTGTLATGSVSLECWDKTATTNVIKDPTTWHAAMYGAQ